MSALDIVAKAAAKGAKKAAPFYSKADLVLQELQRGKGSGNEFLGEMIKKGVKPTELRERGIEQVLKDIPKMTKAEVQKIFEEKAAPKVREQVRGGSDYEEALDLKAQEFLGERDASFYELNYRDKELAKEEVKRDFGYDPETKYEEYSTPGGENYREILLKLPRRGLREGEQTRLMAYEADMRRGKELESFQKREYDELKKKESQSNQDFRSRHFSDTPNILAHIRVQDYITPTYTKQQAENIGQRIADGMGVANPMNLGNGSINIAIKNGYVTPKEAAQYADFRKFQNVDTTGAKRKVLLVDEIQSDWHQEGRKKGYKTKESLEKWYSQNKLEGDPAFADLNAEQINVLERNRSAGMGGDNSVPDAPFKKNWHELAMKRVLDYAAENGYDTVAITPGAEQAKRYDLSQQLESIQLVSPNKESLQDSIFNGYSKDGKVVNRLINTPEELSDLVGKEVAEKLMQQQFVKGKEGNTGSLIRRLENQDLTIGGEGMKGFYDKILPDYLNNYGKKYGAQVGEIDLVTAPGKSTPQVAAPGIGYFPEPVIEPAQTMKFHSIDITPQMREEIKTKGQPMYGKVAMPALEGLAAGSGAATIGPQVFDMDNEQDVQNPIHFSENPDAMRLELMQSNQIE